MTRHGCAHFSARLVACHTIVRAPTQTICLQGAPTPLIGSGLSLLLVGGDGGIYRLVRNRRRDSEGR
jgi:hypothetical protein